MPIKNSVLPASLRNELAAVADALLTKKDLTASPQTVAHAEWAKSVKANHPEIDQDNVMEILQHEVGNVFCEVLKDAGVYKRTAKGKDAFLRFVEHLNGNQRRL